jgi:hypothetical protein
MATAEIGTRSRNGLYEITDTNWDSNGTMRVTVRELIGEKELPKSRVLAMRRLARRALPEYRKGQTRKSPEVNRFFSGGSWGITFAVSRND